MTVPNIGGGIQIATKIWANLVADDVNAVVADVATIPSLYAKGCVVAPHGLTTTFTTTGTHTTFQDEGLTLTAIPPGGRRWKFTVAVNPYLSGAATSVGYRLLAGATVLHEWNVPNESLSSTSALALTLVHTQILGAIGSTVFKVQIAAMVVNAAVSSFGSSTYIRQLIIEDVGVV